MLISFEQIDAILRENSINITGAFHIGAHDCEELGFYNQLGLQNDQIVWIDAIPEKIEAATKRGIPNVYNAVITDKDDQYTVFNISNNGQSSSVLDFKTHAHEYPVIVYIDQIMAKTVTIDTFFERNAIDGRKYNFWNFDIQGAELMALKGAVKHIPHAAAIYLEVNERELYEGCGLIGDIDGLLAGYGFKRVLTSMVRQGWGDALYIKG